MLVSASYRPHQAMERCHQRLLERGGMAVTGNRQTPQEGAQ